MADKGVILSVRDSSRLQRMLRWFEHSRKEKPYRRRNFGGAGFLQASADLWSFEVQSQTSGKVGIYNCYKQTTFGVYAAPEYEVFNVLENKPAEDYPMLCPGDTISAWQMEDVNGSSRWVGFPNVPHVRMARTTEAAGSKTWIWCNLIGEDGITEMTSGLGHNIVVNCKIVPDGASATYNLNEASPRLSLGDYIFVVNLASVWYCTTVFQCVENCECYQS